MRKFIDEKVDWWESWLMQKLIDEKVDWCESWLMRKLIYEKGDWLKGELGYGHAHTHGQMDGQW